MAKRPGREAKVALSEQIKIYNEYKDELIENGHVKPATHDIYTRLSEKMMRQMSAKAIHIAVGRHFEEIFGSEFVKSEKKFEIKSDTDDEETTNENWSSLSSFSILLNESEKKTV